LPCRGGCLSGDLVRFEALRLRPASSATPRRCVGSSGQVVPGQARVRHASQEEEHRPRPGRSCRSFRASDPHRGSSARDATGRAPQGVKRGRGRTLARVTARAPGGASGKARAGSGSSQGPGPASNRPLGGGIAVPYRDGVSARPGRPSADADPEIGVSEQGAAQGVVGRCSVESGRAFAGARYRAAFPEILGSELADRPSEAAGPCRFQATGDLLAGLPPADLIFLSGAARHGRAFVEESS